MADPIAERASARSAARRCAPIGHQSARTQRVLDNDAEYVEPLEPCWAELREDKQGDGGRAFFARRNNRVRRSTANIATASLIEVWIDETERRTWFPVRGRAASAA